MPFEPVTGIEFAVEYSARKTVGIKIDKNARVIVRCPKRFPQKETLRIVRENAGFILKSLEKSRIRIEELKNFSVGVGSHILYLGKEYEVLTQKENAVSFDGKAFYIPEKIAESAVIPSLVKLYKKLAKEYIPPIVERYSKEFGFFVQNVKINSAVTRWGSCSGKNSVNFSWRLIMADEKAVEYVAIHELCHTVEHNHGKVFWQRVEKLCPNYKHCEKSLKELSKRLSHENWN